MMMFRLPPFTVITTTYHPPLLYGHIVHFRGFCGYQNELLLLPCAVCLLRLVSELLGCLLYRFTNFSRTIQAIDNILDHIGISLLTDDDQWDLDCYSLFASILEQYSQSGDLTFFFYGDSSDDCPRLMERKVQQQHKQRPLILWGLRALLGTVAQQWWTKHWKL